MDNIHLQCGVTQAIVRPFGAQLISLKAQDGREVIWQGDPSVWADHTPILFPVCGKPKNDEVIIDGVTYPMAKHGFARKVEYAIDKIGDDFVDLVFTDNEETRAQYPFAFALHVIYSLKENGFSCTFLVENRSDRTMPFCVGGHPAFIVPMEDGATYTDYQLVFPCKEEGKNLLCPGGTLIDGHEYLDLIDGRILPLEHNLFDSHDALLFSEFRSRSVDLVNKNSGHGLRFSYPKMEVLAIWSMPHKNADYVCLEPWHGMPGQVIESGKFEDKPFATLLPPGKSFQCGYDVELI
ncbi:MAG: aldose 1-epimerase family protein [Clostridia bacterium]|nr:aldose 1-epimerase family protein [Clostridia bacterium]